MKRLPIIAVITAGLILSSCAKKSPEFVNSIPDDAIGVISVHPMQIHKKGQLNSFATLKEKAKDEVWSLILEDPLSTGLMMDEYIYLFIRMETEGPVVGVVSGMKDREKFENTIGKIKEDMASMYQQGEDYTFIQPDKEGIIAWNDKQMILLFSPDNDEFETDYYTGSLDKMFHPVKEESITSVVDFKDFQGKMKDLNAWISTDELRKVLETVMADKMQGLPINLYNNYAQVYIDFANGAMNVTAETHFSEEVEKNIEEFLVLNPSLNEEMLKLAPGGNLLLAMAGSMDLGKVQKMVEKYSPPQLDSMSNKVEQAIGLPPKVLLEAFTGDFTIAVNGLEDGAMIPVEVFIGFGVKSEVIQEHLMGMVKGIAPVEEEGDFFVINFQGNEIYSGILDNMWVITNAKGYKDAVEGGGLDRSLVDSKFADFSGGSMGMYLNLDLSSYPSMVKGMLEQKPEQGKWIEQITNPFEYLGVSAGNYESVITLKTNKPSENSLYTILKATEKPE